LRPAGGAASDPSAPGGAAEARQSARPILVPKGSAAPTSVRAADVPAQADVRRRFIQGSPPWLISAAVQMLLIIVMGLWQVDTAIKNSVELVSGYAETLSDSLSEGEVDFTSDMPASDSVSLLDARPVDNPLAAPPVAVTLNGTGGLVPNVDAPAIGLALNGRQEGMKQALLEAFHGTPGTERAVRSALAWIARQQQQDGSWSLKGPYADGASSENLSAATAMALLAFQGNNNTHLTGEYKSHVSKGIKFLIKHQDEDGNFFTAGGRRDQWLYTQGQCTIAICELYAMSRDEALREPAERAVQFCLKAQHSLGGWRYAPGSDSDTSVTGWMMMALQSARMGGIEVPQQNLDLIHNYLDKASSSGGSRYGYQVGGQATETMTAEALLCRQYLGWPRDDARLKKGVAWLLEDENLPNAEYPNVYYWYYATQVMHHMEGREWKAWNNAMRDMLVGLQADAGKEKGSWHPDRPKPDKYGADAGRLYQTCLSTYILEVYYRHLPLYMQGRL
jgi:hypothetical protein